MRVDEVDLGPGAVVLSLSSAEELRPTPAEPAGASAVPPPTSIPEPDGPGTPAPAAAASAVHIEVRATEDDLHTLQRALSALRDLVRPGRLRIELSVAASTDGEAIDKVAFANRVREPLDEDPDVELVSVRWSDEAASAD